MHSSHFCSKPGVMRSSLRCPVALAVLAAVFLVGCAPDKPEALVASAKEYLARNDRNAAVIQLKNALQREPDLAEARFLLGKALLENGDVAAAEKELNKANELRYPFDQLAPALARVALARRDPKKVIADFGKVELASQAGKADLQTTVGAAYMMTANAAAARSAFESALLAVPGYPPAVLGQASLALAEGDAPRALGLTDAALAKAPNFADAWIFKGDLMGAQGQTDDALAAYRKALEIRPNNLAAHSRIVTMLLRTEKTEEAGRQLELMKKAAPKDPQTLYLQALLAVQKKDYIAAREAIQQQLRVARDNVPGLLLLSTIELNTGAYAQAEAALQKVLTQSPNHSFARMILVGTYLRSGQMTRAADALNPLIEGGSDDPAVMALAGDVYMRSGDTARAARYYAKAAQLDPKDWKKRTVLAMSHLAMGESDVGLRELREAAAADASVRTDLVLIAVATNGRKFDAALAAIDALEKKQPDKPLPHDLRGGVLVAKGDRAGARRSFEQALALDAADFTAISGLAKLDVAEGKAAEAQKRFDTLLAKDPKNARALLGIAEVRALSGGSSEEVAALIAKAVAADPASAEPRIALISYYMNAKDAKKAVAAAQDALAAMPNRADVLYVAGQAQQAAGETNQAGKTYNKLAQVRPESPLPLLREAQTQMAEKDYNAAVATLKKALELQPNLLEAQRGLIVAYLGAKRPNDALAVAREVQRQRPKEATGFGYEGDIHASEKAWKEAAAAFKKALATAPSTDLAARTYSALKAGGNDAEAQQLAANWLKSHPKDRDFRAYLAEFALIRGDTATAMAQYKAILDQNPNDAIALNNFAWYAGQNKDPKAIEYAEKANKLVPDNPAILDTLGVLLVERGETKRGIESLQRAVALAPEAANTRLNLARALVKDGQKEAARKELEVLAKLGDKFPAQAEVAKMIQAL